MTLFAGYTPFCEVFGKKNGRTTSPGEVMNQALDVPCCANV